MEQRKRKTFLLWSVAVLLICLLAYLLFELFPIIKDIIINSHNEEHMADVIKSYGFKGVLIILAICAIHPILVIIPITPFQILSGLCYGVIKGGIIVEIGYIIGNVITFTLGRQFKFVIPVMKKKKKESNFIIKTKKLLSESNNPEILSAVLYFIPGIPDGMLPLVLSQTKINYPKYIISMLIGSIPSVIIFTLCGKLFASKEYFWVGLIIIFIFVFSIFLFKKREDIFDMLKKFEDKK